MCDGFYKIGNTLVSKKLSKDLWAAFKKGYTESMKNQGLEWVEFSKDIKSKTGKDGEYRKIKEINND